MGNTVDILDPDGSDQICLRSPRRIAPAAAAAGISSHLAIPKGTSLVPLSRYTTPLTHGHPRSPLPIYPSPAPLFRLINRYASPWKTIVSRQAQAGACTTSHHISPALSPRFHHPVTIIRGEASIHKAFLSLLPVPRPKPSLPPLARPSPRNQHSWDLTIHRICEKDPNHSHP